MISWIKEDSNILWLNTSLFGVNFVFEEPPPNFTPLREKCPNTEFFLVRIFLYSDNWIFGHFSRIVFSIRSIIIIIIIIILSLVLYLD